MAGIKITNRTGDGISVTLGEETAVLPSGGSYSFDRLSGKEYSLTVHRTRIPVETSGSNTGKTTLLEKTDGIEKSVHVPLDTTFDVSLIASRAALTAEADVSGKEGALLDALFSGYRLTGSGAKVSKTAEVFANGKIRKKFLRHQLRNVFMPVGIISVFLLFFGITAVSSVIRGNPVQIGDASATYLTSGILLAFGAAGAVYVICALSVCFRYLKKYSR